MFTVTLASLWVTDPVKPKKRAPRTRNHNFRNVRFIFYPFTLRRLCISTAVLRFFVFASSRRPGISQCSLRLCVMLMHLLCRGLIRKGSETRNQLICFSIITLATGMIASGSSGQWLNLMRRSAGIAVPGSREPRRDALKTFVFLLHGSVEAGTVCLIIAFQDHLRQWNSLPTQSPVLSRKELESGAPQQRTGLYCAPWR